MDASLHRVLCVRVWLCAVLCAVYDEAWVEPEPDLSIPEVRDLVHKHLNRQLIYYTEKEEILANHHAAKMVPPHAHTYTAHSSSAHTAPQHTAHRPHCPSHRIPVTPAVLTLTIHPPCPSLYPRSPERLRQEQVAAAKAKAAQLEAQAEAQRLQQEAAAPTAEVDPADDYDETIPAGATRADVLHLRFLWFQRRQTRNLARCIGETCCADCGGIDPVLTDPSVEDWAQDVRTRLAAEYDAEQAAEGEEEHKERGGPSAGARANR